MVKFINTSFHRNPHTGAEDHMKDTINIELTGHPLSEKFSRRGFSILGCHQYFDSIYSITVFQYLYWRQSTISRVMHWIHFLHSVGDIANLSSNHLIHVATQNTGLPSINLLLFLLGLV